MKNGIVAGFALAGALAFAAGCASGPSGTFPSERAARATGPRAAFVFATPTPAPNHLYVEHNGEFSIYSLPLGPKSKPAVTLAESSPGAIPPAMTADQFGRVALATPTELYFYRPPLRSFAPSAAYLQIPLTPAITQMNPSGAVLADVEFDPNENFWLLNNIGGEVTMLPAPLSKHSVATITIGFGIPGTKAAAYGQLNQARFDVNATLYVYASQPQGNGALLFKTSFPYSKPPSSNGLNLALPDVVDPSQWPAGPPPDVSAGVVYGQYVGPLATSPPQKPPPIPVNAVAQFPQPFNQFLLPDATIDVISGGLVVDANRGFLYVLDGGNGALKVFPMPFANGAKPVLVLRCAAGKPAYCSQKPEHIFLAP